LLKTFLHIKAFCGKEIGRMIEFEIVMQL